MLRQALAALLSLEDDIEIVAEVAAGDVIVATALRTRPDVAVIDIEPHGMDGLSAAAELHERLPQCRTLILTGVGSRATCGGRCQVTRGRPTRRAPEITGRAHGHAFRAARWGQGERAPKNHSTATVEIQLRSVFWIPLLS